MILYLYLWR